MLLHKPVGKQTKLARCEKRFAALELSPTLMMPCNLDSQRKYQARQDKIHKLIKYLRAWHTGASGFEIRASPQHGYVAMLRDVMGTAQLRTRHWLKRVECRSFREAKLEDSSVFAQSQRLRTCTSA